MKGRFAPAAHTLFFLIILLPVAVHARTDSTVVESAFSLDHDAEELILNTQFS